MKASGKVRVGVVGVGVMGELHCRVASRVRSIDLVGVYDLDGERARHIAATYETRCFSAIDDLLQVVDAAVIAVPTSLHRDLALAALGAGRHVLIEKPVASTIEDADAILAAAHRLGRVCGVGHTERYSPTFRELQSVIGTDRPVAINIRRLSPFPERITDADVALDLMIHDVDLVLAVSGTMPSFVSAVGLRVRSSSLDHIEALLAFPDGVVSSLTASRVTEDKVRRIEVSAPGRYLVADLLTRTLTIHRRAVSEREISGGEVKFRLESITQQVQVPSIEPLYAELTDFAAAVLEGRPPLVGLDDGRRALEIVLGVRALAERHSEVSGVSTDWVP